MPVTNTEYLHGWLGTILPVLDETKIFSSYPSDPSNLPSSSVINSKYTWPLRDNLPCPSYRISNTYSTPYIVHQLEPGKVPSPNGVLFHSTQSYIWDAPDNSNLWCARYGETQWDKCTQYYEQTSGYNKVKTQFLGGYANGDMVGFNDVRPNKNPLQLYVFPTWANPDYNMEISNGITNFMVCPTKWNNIMSLTEFAPVFMVPLPTAEEYNTFTISPVVLQNKISSAISGRTTIATYSKSVNQYSATFTWSDSGYLANKLYRVFQLIAENGTPLILVGQGTIKTYEYEDSEQQLVQSRTLERHVCDMIFLEQIPEIKQTNRTTWQVTITGRSQPVGG